MCLSSKCRRCGTFFVAWGVQAKQGAIGLVIGGDYFEIGFPLEETPRNIERQERRSVIMSKKTEKIAAALGRTLVAQVPHSGGAHFGAARLAKIVANIQARLVPGQGRRPGRPTDASGWAQSQGADERRDAATAGPLAEQSSSVAAEVESPMQIAAKILEEALDGLPGHSDGVGMPPGRDEKRSAQQIFHVSPPVWRRGTAGRWFNPVVYARGCHQRRVTLGSTRRYRAEKDSSRSARRSSRGFPQRHRENCPPPETKRLGVVGSASRVTVLSSAVFERKLSSSKATSVGGGVMGVEAVVLEEDGDDLRCPQLLFRGTGDPPFRS